MDLPGGRALHNQESRMGRERKISVPKTGGIIALELVCLSFLASLSEPELLDPACYFYVQSGGR